MKFKKAMFLMATSFAICLTSCQNGDTKGRTGPENSKIMFNTKYVFNEKYNPVVIFEDPQITEESFFMDDGIHPKKETVLIFAKHLFYKNFWDDPFLYFSSNTNPKYPGYYYVNYEVDSSYGQVVSKTYYNVFGNEMIMETCSPFYNPNEVLTPTIGYIHQKEIDMKHSYVNEMEVTNGIVESEKLTFNMKYYFYYRTETYPGQFSRSEEVNGNFKLEFLKVQ